MAVDIGGRSTLHLAAQRGNVGVIEYILSTAKDFDVNGKDCRGKTAVHFAVENRRAYETIRALVSHGADLRVKDGCGRSALHYAATLGSLNAVKRLLEPEGMADELCVADCFGMTPLQVASYHNFENVIVFLREVDGYRDRRKESHDLGITGNRDLSDAGLENKSIRHFLLTSTQSRHEKSSCGLLQDLYSVSRRWKSRLGKLQPQPCSLTQVDTYYRLFKMTAMAFTVWRIVVFLWRISCR